jgi:hypothetical protein
MTHSPSSIQTTKVRQGETGRNVRNVLVYSLTLAILAGIGYFAIIALS